MGNGFRQSFRSLATQDYAGTRKLWCKIVDAGVMIVAELGTVYAADDPADRVRIILEHAKAASECGVDAVKVQLFVPDEPLFCSMPGDDARWERWRKTHLTLEQWRKIKIICETDYKIDLFASAFQLTGVDWCNELGFKWHKVASRASYTYPWLKLTPKTMVFVSGVLDRVAGQNELCIKRLHCVSSYPVTLDTARWPTETWSSDGLSDHSGTPWPSLDALARGAEIIEVHFALDKNMAGPDKPVCLGPEQLKLICDFRNALREMRCSV